ncbi:MAG: DUF945 family protein [Gammaproteobacteria bacterium]
MRIMRGVLASLIVVIVTAVVFIPPLVGLALQKWIDIGRYIPGMQKSFVRVVDYKRGWFSSDATSIIKISDTSLRNILLGLGASVQDLPDSIDLVIVQHIQHGPIFYGNAFSHLLGFAAIDHKLVIPQNEQALFTKLNITDSILRSSETVLGFTGKFNTQFEIKNYYMAVPTAALEARFELIKANISQWLFSDRLKGKIVFNNFYLKSDTSSIVLPRAAIKFDLQRDQNGLWVGSHKLSLSKIIIRDAVDGSYEVDDLNSTGDIGEISDLLTAKKDVTVKNIQYKDQVFGPFLLQVSADRLNAEAISNLIAAYKDIREHGELYESQMRQKLFLILPNVVSPGASIRIDKLQVNTPDGLLQVQAKLAWPHENFMAPDNVQELMRSSKLQASLRISTTLVDRMISIASKLTYLYQVPPEDRGALLDLNNNIRLMTQQNTNAILDLVQTNELSEEDSLGLLTLARNNVSYEDYAQRVRTLLFARKINRETMYLLDWLYSDLATQQTMLDQGLQRYEVAVEKQLHSQLDQLLRMGYVVQNKDDYYVTLVREEGVFKVNGKEIH